MDHSLRVRFHSSRSITLEQSHYGPLDRGRTRVRNTMANPPTVKAPRKIGVRAVKAAEQVSFAYRILVRKALRAFVRTLAFESLNLRRYTRSSHRPAKNAHSRSWCLRCAERQNHRNDTFSHGSLHTKGWAQSFRFPVQQSSTSQPYVNMRGPALCAGRSHRRFD